MLLRGRMRTVAVLAAAVMATVGTTVLAADSDAPERATGEASNAAPPPAERSPFGEKYYTAPTAERRPLMQLLERANLAGPLDDARIRVFGHVQGGYTYNPDDPALDLNLGRVFDVEANQAVLNQVDLSVERIVNRSRSEWDVGGRAQ